MKKLFFLIFSFFSLNSLYGTLNPNERDAIVKDINNLINFVYQLQAELDQIKSNNAINTLRHIDEMQQKDDENAQLKKQLEYFARSYNLLCEIFAKNTHSIRFRNAFKVLRNTLVDLDNSSEVTADMETAAENLNQAMEETLRPLGDAFIRQHRKEIKNNLTAGLLEQKESALKYEISSKNSFTNR